MSRITKALLALALLALAAPASAAAAPRLEPVGTFEGPVHAIGAPGDPSRLYVVEIGGRVRVVRDGIVQPTPFLTIDDVLGGGERGLLSIAFPPDYATSGLFYVYLTSEPAGDLEVREYRRSAGNPDLADPASGRLVWSAAHPGQDNHNGGTVAFGPDGKLWFATGDGGGSNDPLRNARDPAHPLGKLLRIDPRQGNAGSYTIPADNPFGNAVWAYGLRNPFRFTFDRIAGDLWIGDVGQDRVEEVDWVRFAEGLGQGTDYEWSCMEGTLDGPNTCPLGNPHTPPVLDYPTPSAGGAVTGGFRVRDPGLPSLVGRYLYADFFDGAIHSVVPSGASVAGDAYTGLARPRLAAFGEDACGHVYVVSLNGTVDRIQEGPSIGPCVPGFLGTGATPGPPGSGPGPPTAPDRTSPRVNIRVARRGRVGRRATPRILLTASENCRVTIRARLAKTSLKRVRTPLRAGRRTVVRLRPKAKAIKKIRRALRRHKRVRMTVKVTAVDAAGNTGRVTKRLKVRRG
jgi:hypothetical protein